MKKSHYVHGATSQEQARLSRLNELINRARRREMRLRGGESVLDLGSGLGPLTRMMAVRAGRVVGIERDPRQLAAARKLAGSDRLEFRKGEALDLSLRAGEWGSFDVVHARFLLEQVPDPLGVVKTMVRAARPGPIQHFHHQLDVAVAEEPE